MTCEIDYLKLLKDALNDDGAALRLAALLRINIYHFRGCSAAEADGGIEYSVEGVWSDSTRKAIVMVAEEMISHD